MCELFVETKYTHYKVTHPMLNLSNGEDYALYVFPMADKAELAGGDVINGRFHYWYRLYSKGDSLDIKIAVPLAS